MGQALIKDSVKISIVTAVYNAVDTLEQTIVSVLEQDYNNIEYIIIDGGSNDGTVDIIQRYQDKLAYWCSESDNGVYEAFNKGIAQATGDYIQFLGADDALYSSNVISNVVAELQDDIDILSTCGYLVDEKLKIERFLSNDDAASGETRTNGHMPPHPGMFVRLPVMQKYMFDTTYKVAADYKFFLTCYLREKIKFKYILTPTFFFSDGGMSGSANEVADCENMRLWQEFGLSMCIEREKKLQKRKSKENIFKFRVIKYRLLDWLGLLSRYKCCHKRWRRHRCNNAVCRWCGRVREDFSENHKKTARRI